MTKGTRSKIGLCLCGGGITGGIYQVGCLTALEERLQDFRANDFDIYVGTSSGATVATALAGGLSAQRMYRALLDPSDVFFKLQRNHLLKPDRAELKRVFSSALMTLRAIISSAAVRPFEIKVADELERFMDSLPAGLFALDGYERFLSEIMQRRGIPNRFDQMPKTLRIVANDLDTGGRAVFGAGELADVPVSQAVAASSAIPLIFAPVRIGERDYVDGGLGDAAHIDLAAQFGCQLIVVINPMVPVRASDEEDSVPTGHGRARRVRDKGLVWVYHQALRMRNQARLLLGLARFRGHHPEIEVVLLEPEPSAAMLFLHSSMNFMARRAVIEEGYTSTAKFLKDENSQLRKALIAHGLTLAV
jgi:NTE family protein